MLKFNILTQCFHQSFQLGTPTPRKRVVASSDSSKEDIKNIFQRAFSNTASTKNPPFSPSTGNHLMTSSETGSPDPYIMLLNEYAVAKANALSSRKLRLHSESVLQQAHQHEQQLTGVNDTENESINANKSFIPEIDNNNVRLADENEVVKGRVFDSRISSSSDSVSSGSSDDGDDAVDDQQLARESYLLGMDLMDPSDSCANVKASGNRSLLPDKDPSVSLLPDKDPSVEIDISNSSNNMSADLFSPETVPSEQPFTQRGSSSPVYYGCDEFLRVYTIPLRGPLHHSSRTNTYVTAVPSNRALRSGGSNDSSSGGRRRLLANTIATK